MKPFQLPRRAALAAAIAAACLAGSAASQEGTEKTYEPARTPWCHPDLQGTWPVNHLTGVPLQRDESIGTRRLLNDEELAVREASYAEREGRYEGEIEGGTMGMGHWVEWGTLNRLSSLIIDPPNGRLPEMTEEGLRRKAGMRSGWMDIPFDHWSDFDNWDRCITRSLPASMLPAFYNSGIQIIQTPDHVVINMEMIHEARIVRLDAEPLDENIRGWLGDSRGWWDGDTLVVETRNFNGKGSSTNMHTVGSPPDNTTPLSTEYVLTERFTPTGPNTLTYEATVNDPVIWTQPWTVQLPWVKQDDYDFFEYACHEGNTMIRYYIETSRAERGIEPTKPRVFGPSSDRYALDEQS